MRVYLFLLCLFIQSLVVSASTCEERVLRKYNDRFHDFLNSEFKENSDLELFKSIGFLGKASEDGFRLALNIELGNLASAKNKEKFKELTIKFIENNSRDGEAPVEDNGFLSFYPEDGELPCLEKSLFLKENAAICSVDNVSFNNVQLEDLNSFLTEVFEKISQLELREVDPSPTSLNKKVEVLIDEMFIGSTDFEFEVSGGICDMGKALKRSFNCTIVGGDSLSIKLAGEGLSDELVLTVNTDIVYVLQEQGDKLHYNVLKSEVGTKDTILSAKEFEVLTDKCSASGELIECEPSLESYTLNVVPEKKSDKSLSVDVIPSSGFELKVSSDENARYKIISAHTYLKGIENTEELQKVSFVEMENCDYISKKRSILKCKKLLSPYSVRAIYTGVETLEKSVEIGTFNKFSLEVASSELSSVSQTNKINILGDGGKISTASLSEYNLSIKLRDIKDHKVSLSSENLEVTSEKERGEYSIKVDLYEGSEIVDSKEVKVSKYVAGDNYFFDMIKNNRRCSFKLMKFVGDDNFQTIGQEEYIKNLMRIKVKSKRSTCSDVQKTKGSIQIFCSISKDKLKENVVVELESNGSVVRTVSCMLYNNDYFYESDSEEEEDEEERVFNTKKSSTDFSDSLEKSLTTAIPEYMKSKYQTQTPMYYNPLMYNYGYNPYSAYTPGYYQSPGLWNTMYMFNPATY